MQHRQLSFSQKVLATILGVVAVSLGGMLFFFQQQTQDIADQEITDRLEQTRRTFESFESQTITKLRIFNYYISGNAYFQAYMSRSIRDNDPESMRDQFEEMQRFSGLDFAVLTDVDGVPVASNLGPEFIEKAGKEITDLTFAYEEMVEVESAGWFSAGGKLYLVVMSPIVEADYIVGFIIAGYEVDDFIDETSQVTHCDLVLLTQNDKGEHTVAAAGLAGEDMAMEDLTKQIEEIYRKSKDQETFEITLDGRVYRAGSGELLSQTQVVVGRYLTMKSLAEEAAPFTTIIKRAMIIGALVSLLLIPVSLLAAGRVTRPVNRLVENIEEVRAGEYDETRIEVCSSDEIGKMAEAFKAMVKELREQQELIEFLERSHSQGGESEATQDLTATQPTVATSAHRTRNSSMLREEIRAAVAAGGALPKGFLLGQRYQVIKELGRGGMGVVYQALDRELDEVVALKMLLAESPEMLEMMKRETKLARKVTHKNIVRIYDFGVQEDVQFISMEYVRGTTLKTLLKRERKLPPSIGLRIVRECCRGLGAAHESGIVHGDIKPENIIIDSRGLVKIMDFGVARTSKDSNNNDVAGTPAYMAPEQFQGELEPASDIYCLGVMMFQMFGGLLPFQSQTLVDLMRSHLQQPPPRLREVDPDLPEQLEMVILKTMQKDPRGRYENVALLWQDLRTLV